MRRLLALAVLALPMLAGATDPPPDNAGDAVALDRLLVDNYAYLDRLPRAQLPETPQLAAERAAVHDRASLLHWAEDRLTTLADHHASTGSSFRDSWALVPSYADLWIVQDARGFVVDAVRLGSPAGVAGIRAGDRLLEVDGHPIASAVAAFWAATARPDTADADAYGARVLAAGRRDRPRRLTIAGHEGRRDVMLQSVYATPSSVSPRPLSCLYLPAARGLPGRAKVHFFNSLGDAATIAATDACLARLSPGDAVELDLTDTPSGGNTTVARAIMGWFVDRATGYQIHSSPAEERETGIGRQWIEQVLPRAGKHHVGPVSVVVGRWTGSMGEGLAIGLRAAGARVCGGPMAGLRGAIEDVRLPLSGLVVKFPTERLSTVDGIPRERFVPPACS